MPSSGVISEFQGEYRWLSNFWHTPVEYEGVVYPSAEHAYQAAKTDSPEERRWILQSASAGLAKRRGKEVNRDLEWRARRLAVMRKVLRSKFRNPEMARKLLATGDAVLEEGNRWGDFFWGVCGGEGENHLGNLLMEIRATLRKKRRQKKESKP